jgi:hypothetical protein
MAERWEDVEELLVAAAGDDLEAHDDVVPALVAFSGEELLFVGWVRLFPPGEHRAAVQEICVLALALGADRVAMSFGARVWSLTDPIPPVVPEGDLRQRAVTVHLVDGQSVPPREVHALRPFDVVDGGIRWHPRMEHGDLEGWIPVVLRRAATPGRHVLRSERDVLGILRWVTGQGHDVYLGAALARRLGVAADAP